MVGGVLTTAQIFGARSGAAGLTGCASQPAGAVGSASLPPAQLAERAAAPAPDAVDVILRLAPRPTTAEIMLLERNTDGSLRPFFRGQPWVGFDTNISPAAAGREAVLFVRAPGHVPQAYAFTFSDIADFFPTLRSLPATGPATPRGEAEELGDAVRRLVEAGKVVDVPSSGGSAAP
jgi:hypothetical protein